MRNRLMLFLVISMFVISSQVFAQAPAVNQPQVQVQDQEKTKAPDLPDYTKEPYFFVRDANQIHSIMYPERGDNLKGKLYQDGDDSTARNWIMVFVNDDGGFTYAEWIQVNEDRTEATLRSYKLEDDKWVFDKEKRQG